MFQQTSLLAYIDLKDINAKQQQVFRMIERLRYACNQDIARELGWEINRITPRVLELRDKKLVEEAYRDINPETKRKVIYWRVS